MASKHRKKADIKAPNPENVDSPFVTAFEVYKAIRSFPNGSGAVPDKIVPQVFKDLIVNQTAIGGSFS